jgi:O-glycosyl hydrolase
MKKALMAVSFLIASLGIALYATRLPAEPDATITVNPAETHQTMRGWEVTARAWEMNKKLNRFDATWELYRDEIMDRMVNELGINRIRIAVKSGFENPVDYWALFRDGKISYREYGKHFYEKINDNDDPFVANPDGFHFSALDYTVEQMLLPMRKRLEANGERLFVNLIYIDFGGPLKSAMSHAQNPEEYAELIVRAFEHLKRRHGITPDALEITLEPENTDHWRGRQIGEAMVAAAKRLRQAGFNPQMIAPSTTAASATPRYFDELARVPGAVELLSELAYHRYRDASPNEILPEIVKRARKHGVETAMLEHVGGDVTELHADLTLGNASAWQQWGIATERGVRETDRGAYYYFRDAVAREGAGIKMAERTRGLAQYFRYVRAGAVRLSATANRSDVLPVAFRNRDGGIVVVAQAKQAGNITVLGLPAGTYAARYTTELETARELPASAVPAGGPLVGHLPAPGIITFFRRNPG